MASEKNKKNKNSGLWFAWGLLIAVDLGFRGPLWLFHNLTGMRFLANYFMSAIALLALLYILAFIKRKIFFWPLYVILLVIPVFLQGNYFMVYKKFISPSEFAIFFDSTRMAIKTGAANISLLTSVFLLIFAVFAGIMLYHSHPRRKWGIIPAFFVYAGFSVFLTLHWYGIDFFQQNTVAFYNNLALKIISGNEQTLRTHREKVTPVVHKKKLPDLVFVVGESQVLSHMSLYGYHRKTTPLLDDLYLRHKIVPFQKAVSIGNKTRLSVPYMLVGLEGPDPKGAFFSFPSLFDYARAAGYFTLFLSAQDMHWGQIGALFDDNSIDILKDGNFFSSHVDVHKGVDDLVMLNHVFQYLKQYGSPFMLVLQMDGSHYPYNEHSPDSLKVFLPETSPNCTNAYDNTLIVTDIYLTRLYRFLNSRFPGAFMFFTPDHGQNFGGLNGRFNDNFTPDVFHNALIAFPPEDDRAAYKTLLKKEKRLISQADIFSTMLDLMEIEPQYKVDGISLFDTVYRRRVITCSEYMPTFHNNPLTVVVDSGLQTRLIDFSRHSVTDSHAGLVYPYRKLPLWIRRTLDDRLNRSEAVKIIH